MAVALKRSGMAEAGAVIALDTAPAEMEVVVEAVVEAAMAAAAVVEEVAEEIESSFRVRLKVKTCM